ncbi:MAG: hypothetical protein Kow0029_19280 [Candidatus Rifleibacteriota bacterium]
MLTKLVKIKLSILLVILVSASLSPISVYAETEAQNKEATINPLFALTIVTVFDLADLGRLTGGFIEIGQTGIYSTERSYKKNGVELQLIGMAHVAEKEFYEDIKKSLLGRQALMLMEGVTDENKLLTTPPDYGGLAKKLGGENQKDIFSPKDMPENVKLIRADLDTSDFSQPTIKLLNLAGRVHTKEGFNFSALLMMYFSLTDMDTDKQIMDDLIQKRNACLISHLQKSITSNKLILVPWGALHLPEIEKWALTNGFKLAGQKHRVIFRFPAYFKYLLSDRKEIKNGSDALNLLESKN